MGRALTRCTLRDPASTLYRPGVRSSVAQTGPTSDEGRDTTVEMKGINLRIHMWIC